MQELMDRALKERIVGAIVLVVFAVLVVPVFLDGPSEAGGEITESITLPGQEGSATRTQTIILNRDRSEPVPAPPQSSGQSEPPAASAQQARVASKAPTSIAATEITEAPPRQEPAAQDETPQSSTGMWAVQLGSFGNKENAEKLAADLRKNGYAAFLSQLAADGKSMHRVRVGPQKNRNDAESVARRLASAGHTGQVVPHP